MKAQAITLHFILHLLTGVNEGSCIWPTLSMRSSSSAAAADWSCTQIPCPAAVIIHFPLTSMFN